MIRKNSMLEMFMNLNPNTGTILKFISYSTRVTCKQGDKKSNPLGSQSIGQFRSSEKYFPVTFGPEMSSINSLSLISENKKPIITIRDYLGCIVQVV